MKNLILFLVALVCVTAHAQFKPTPYDTNNDATAQAFVASQIGAQVSGSNYLNAQQVGSQIGGSNYTTSAQIAGSNFLNAAQVGSQIGGSNYTTSAQIAGSNFLNSAQVGSQIGGSNYTTSAQIAGSNFLNAAQVGSQIGGSNYSPIVSVLTNALFPLTINVKSYGAAGDGVTDDTVAFQSAIDALTNSGGKILIPPGTYFINGQFTTPPGSATLTNFSQLHLPARDLQTQAIVGITFEGLETPTLNTIWTTNTLPPASTNGCTILSTKVPTNTLYSIISGGAPSTSPYQQTAVYVRFDKIAFRTYDNPKTTALNLQWVAQADIENCTIDTGTGGGAQSEPTNAAIGLALPAINNWVISRVRNTDIRGYNVGTKVSEHSDIDDLRIWMCEYAFWFPGGTHDCYMGHTVVSGCKYGVIGGPAGFVQRIFWSSYATEHSALTTNSSTGSALWANTVADFWDTNSTLRGMICFATGLSGVGAVDTLIVNNTTNVTFYNKNSHAFQQLVIDSPGTNEPIANYLFQITDSNGVPVSVIGHYPQPFQSFIGFWMGPQGSGNAWRLATNFTLLSDSTNQTTLNVGQPEGGSASSSVLQFQVGHQNVVTASNNVITTFQPLNHGYFGLSNLVSGQLYTNTWWKGPIHMNTCIQLVKAAISGSSAMQIRTFGFTGAVTNTVGDTTSVTTIADSGDFRMIEADVPPGGSFTFTNTSTGAGNSVTLFSVQMKGD